MRKCNIKNVGPALFHKWGQGFLVQTHFEMCAMGTVGICELPDGSIIKPPPEDIQFITQEQPAFNNVKQLIAEFEKSSTDPILVHNAKQEILLTESILNP